MGVKATFKNDIDNVFGEFLAEVERQIIESLYRVGEEAVTHAKLIAPEIGFKDQTGALRSSIGYAVFKDGTPISLTFEAGKGEGASEGVKTGESLAKQVGATTEGYALVVVAGMNYAVHVESKGRDVLTSAEKLAEKSIARELADLITNIKDAFR